jgi:hypothetical protein
VSAGRRPPASGGPTLLDAMADPALFGPWFTPRAPWAAWRAFLAALFGLPMSEDQAALWPPDAARRPGPGGEANHFLPLSWPSLPALAPLPRVRWAASSKV